MYQQRRLRRERGGAKSRVGWGAGEVWQEKEGCKGWSKKLGVK
jgi:hypothetical protein